MASRGLSVEKVAAHFGTKTALAAVVGLTRGALRFWAHGVPPEYVLTIEKASGGKLTRHAMRPDIYPVERPKRARKHKNGKG